MTKTCFKDIRGSLKQAAKRAGVEAETSNVERAWHVMSLKKACTFFAGVVKLVDALDSKSSAARRAGSIPASGTTK